MSYRATPHTATGVTPCQLMMGREIRTLLATLESNLRQVLSRQQAVATKDEETKINYRRHFDKRHGVQPLPVRATARRLSSREARTAESVEDTWESHRKKSGS